MIFKPLFNGIGVPECVDKSIQWTLSIRETGENFATITLKTDPKQSRVQILNEQEQTCESGGILGNLLY
ncbi:MAG: hypothetical protein H7A33_07005 [Deltaproteobacteria bacterium]|nr:hypothetical protein [Deltaproteobacteria bacterium]